jgi:hypothetical protein
MLITSKCLGKQMPGAEKFSQFLEWNLGKSYNFKVCVLGYFEGKIFASS